MMDFFFFFFWTGTHGLQDLNSLTQGLNPWPWW